MAICVSITPGGIFSAATTTKIQAGLTATSTTGSGGTVLSKVAFWSADATYANNVYSCAAGSYLLVTPAEFNASNSSPFVAGPEHYAAVTSVFGIALTALCVIWGVKKVLHLLNQHTDS
jgi:hypothetical protein